MHPVGEIGHAPLSRNTLEVSMLLSWFGSVVHFWVKLSHSSSAAGPAQSRARDQSCSAQCWICCGWEAARGAFRSRSLLMGVEPRVPAQSRSQGSRPSHANKSQQPEPWNTYGVQVWSSAPPVLCVLWSCVWQSQAVPDRSGACNANRDCVCLTLHQRGWETDPSAAPSTAAAQTNRNVL